MTDRSETSPPEAIEPLLEAALPIVPFDGWSDITFEAAVAGSGMDREDALRIAPRRGLDLAIAFHKRDDRTLAEEAAHVDLHSLRYSDRVTQLVRMRLEIAGRNKEAVRRAFTLFALPLNAPEGARLIWATADAIWNALGDSSRDYNWYSKRAILSGVYSSTLMYWLGDQSPGSIRSWDFLDRRIEGVMRIEKTKSRLKKNPLARLAMIGPKLALSFVRAPVSAPAMRLPGSFTPPRPPAPVTGKAPIDEK